MVKSDCTIVVCSCDKYDDLWNPFFKLLKKNWEKCNYEIILNTESKNYRSEYFNVKTFSFYKNSDNPKWGERMLKHLDKVDTDFTLVLLDDFFIRSKVDENRITECMTWMKANENISVFSFAKVDDENNTPSSKYIGFDLRPQVGEYKFNLQCGLWRTSHLKSYIKKHESPWEWEIIGNKRSYLVPNEFYTLSTYSSEKIIDYGFNNTSKNDINAGSWGVVRGKWAVESVKDLFAENNIDIDYSIRGFYDKDLERNNHTKIKLTEAIKIRWTTFRSLGFKYWSLKKYESKK